MRFRPKKQPGSSSLVVALSAPLLLPSLAISVGGVSVGTSGS